MTRLLAPRFAAVRIFGVLLLWLSLTGEASATLCLDHARASIRASGQATEQAGVADVVLPYNWDQRNRGQSGRARFELEFALDRLPAEPWSIFLPRIGNAYEIFLNDVPVDRQGDVATPNAADHGQVPRLVSIAPNLLRQNNHLRIDLRADVGRRGGLSRVCLGAERELRLLFNEAFRGRTMATTLVCLFSLAAGVLALALWAMQVSVAAPGAPRRGRRDPLFLYASAAELAWAFSLGSGLIEVYAIPWPWHGLLNAVANGLWALGMAMVCLHSLGKANSKAATWIPVLSGLAALIHVSAVVAALWFGRLEAMTFSYGLLAMNNLVLGSAFVMLSMRQSAAGPRLLGLAFVVNVLMGFRDLYALRLNASFEEIPWIRYSSVLFGLALVYLMLSRFRELGAQARAFQATLQQRVAQREQELAQSYQKLESLARVQERSAERNRILRDMHDGVGSNLSAAIRQLQSGRADPEQLLMSLRESLDHLKLSIDAMHLTPGDVTGMLANLRYRFEPRFALSDIRLKWQVARIEPIARLDAKAMQQLQFVVFGAFSNVLQHAQASEIIIEAGPIERGVLLRVSDDGVGFDASAPWRRGLQSMKDRAQSIGAEFRIQSRAGRTAVELIIPKA